MYLGEDICNTFLNLNIFKDSLFLQEIGQLIKGSKNSMTFQIFKRNLRRKITWPEKSSYYVHGAILKDFIFKCIQNVTIQIVSVVTSCPVFTCRRGKILRG